MEVSALAALSGFARGPLMRHNKETVGVIEAGAESACLGIFQQNSLVLVRKFDFGANRLIERVARQMGVDAETAQDIIRGDAIDIGQMTLEVLGPFLRQVSISKEFVERKCGEPIRHWYLSGGMALTNYWSDQIAHTVGGAVRVWNPFDGLEVDPRASLEAAKGQEVRFSAAVGAAIGAMEES
jgi:Tfp pilus assembly PilM family ATPase